MTVAIAEERSDASDDVLRVEPGAVAERAADPAQGDRADVGFGIDERPEQGWGRPGQLEPRERIDRVRAGRRVGIAREVG